MFRSTLGTITLAVLVVAASFGPSTITLAEAPYLGGKTTRMIPRIRGDHRDAFSFPATNLSMIRREGFYVGNSFFQNAWVTAPASTTARDGLGPLFNANACQSCHLRDGRGRPPIKPNEKFLSMLLRVSIPPTGAPGETEAIKHHGAVPDPTYGYQIQNRAIPGVAPEAEIKVTWEVIEGKYGDGTPYTLRKPVYELTNLGYGPLHPKAALSGRVAPQMIGLGLLDAIAEKDILAKADPDDADGDGISGRANQVWDAKTKKTVLGRFGWKAAQPNVRQQVASAFAGDIGISSNLFPGQICTASQTECSAMPTGGKPEVTDEILDFMTFYSKVLAVPGQRSHDNPVVIKGQKLFRDSGCAACHTEKFTTGNDPDFPELSNQEIHPYTNLLVHDMGDGLADGRPEFQATGREWRTPPLWGIGLIYKVNRHRLLLHDGRARSLAEAILWHGGEAQRSKEKFRTMSAEDRRALLVFLKSL